MDGLIFDGEPGNRGDRNWRAWPGHLDFGDDLSDV